MSIERTIRPTTICVDFDGTCVTHEYPNVGKDIGAAPVLKKLVANGHRLILWTMRDNKGPVPIIGTNETQSANFLQDAIDWFIENDIPLYGVQRNPGQDSWTSSPKAYAEIYIDDAALGCPLKYSMNNIDHEVRPFVNWAAVEEILKQKGLIK
jgi:hypothetical protein